MREKELSIRQAIGAHPLSARSASFNRSHIARGRRRDPRCAGAFQCFESGFAARGATYPRSTPGRPADRSFRDRDLYRALRSHNFAVRIIAGHSFSRPLIISSVEDNAGAGGLRVGRVHRFMAALQVAIAVPLLVIGRISLDRVRSTATSDLGFASDLLYAAPTQRRWNLTPARRLAVPVTSGPKCQPSEILLPARAVFHPPL